MNSFRTKTNASTERRSTRSTTRIHLRAPAVLGLAVAVLLLAALLAPLAGSAQDAPTQEPIATEETGVETPVDDSPVVEESPVAEETPVVDETPVAGETPGAGPDSL